MSKDYLSKFFTDNDETPDVQESKPERPPIGQVGHSTISGHHMKITVHGVPCKSWHLDSAQSFRHVHGRPNPALILRQRGFDMSAPVFVVSQGSHQGEIVMQPEQQIHTAQLRGKMKTWHGHPVRYMGKASQTHNMGAKV